MKFFLKAFRISIWIGLINHLINASLWRSNSFLGNVLDYNFFLINYAYCFTILIVIMAFFDFLDRILSWEKQGIIKLIVGILGSAIVVVPTFFLCKVVHYVIILKQKSFSDFVAQESWKNYVLTVVFSLAITFFFLMIGFYKALQEKRVTEQKIIAGTATAKFAALKNQLDPHFLFNSLNVLTALIEEDSEAAQKFTTSLSKVYRYVLEQKNKDVVSIEEELKFAKLYMSLLQMRFENSIFLELPEIIQNPEAKIVPLSLQLLLENTVKHNVVMVDKPLRIKIYEENGFLCVTNNLQPKGILKTESGVGLANIFQRYEMLTNRKFSVEKTKDEFVAKLPVLNKKITIVKKEEKLLKVQKSLDYDLAKDKVNKIRGFYTSLIMYCIIIPFFIILNLRTSPHYYWFFFPMIGWGFGILIHGLNTFKNNLFLGKDWEQRKLKQFLEEENTKG